MRFAVHRPGQRRASPRSHGTPCRDTACCDVPGRVHISMARVAAGDAHEQRLALATVRSDMPARRAPLATERGIDLLHPTRSLLLQPGHQPTPTSGEDRPVQPGLLTNIAAGTPDRAPRRTRHVRDLQTLNPNQIKPARQIGRGLLHPILATVRIPGPKSRDDGLDLTATVRAALSPGQSALQAPQAALLTGRGLWTGQQFASGQSRGHHHAPVHTDDLAVARCGNRVWDHRERDMPTTRPVPGHPIRPHINGNGTTAPKPHPPHLGYPHRTSTPIELPDLLRPDPYLPETLIPSRLAPRRPAMRTPKELCHRLREIPQRLLLHRLRPSPQPPEPGPRLGQLTRLLTVAWCRGPAALPMRMLLHSQVPDEPSMPTMRRQPYFLGGRRKQPVTGHPAKLLEHAFDRHSTHRPPRPGSARPQPEDRSIHRWEP